MICINMPLFQADVLEKQLLGYVCFESFIQLSKRPYAEVVECWCAMYR